MSLPTARAARASELRRRNRELLILNRIASALNGSLELPEALRTTLAQVAEWLDLRTGWIWLLDEDSEQPYLAAAQNLPPALARNRQRMEGWCYCLETFAAGDLSGAANVNVVTCSRLKSLVDGTDGLRYHASIPLYAHGKRLGVMNLASADWRELAPDELRLLHTIGDLLSIAVERARLYARSAQHRRGRGAQPPGARDPRHPRAGPGRRRAAAWSRRTRCWKRARTPAQVRAGGRHRAGAGARQSGGSAPFGARPARRAAGGAHAGTGAGALAREWSMRGQLRITFTARGGAPGRSPRASRWGSTASRKRRWPTWPSTPTRRVRASR